MTFESRSRQAAQGVRRAVEVMEMSSTKTPPRLARFDRYRDGKSRNKRLAALALGIAVPVLLLVAVLMLRTEGDRNVPIAQPSTLAAPTSVSGHSDDFKEPFSFVLPPGWTFGDDDPGWLRLEAPSSVASGTQVYALMNMRATLPDCTGRPDQTVGASSDAITRWLSRYRALDATSPRPITLPGASGSWVDLELAQGWDQTCLNGPVLLANPRGGESWGIEHTTEKMRFYVLDLPDGNTVTVVVDARHAADFEDVVREAASVVESFDFSR